MRSELGAQYNHVCYIVSSGGGGGGGGVGGELFILPYSHKTESNSIN